MRKLLFLLLLWPSLAYADMQAWMTAYAPGAGAQKSGVTASGSKVRIGVVAVSRDIEKRLRLKFGDVIIIEGFGKFVFEDRTACYKRRIVDMYVPCKKSAKKFGAHRVTISKYVE